MKDEKFLRMIGSVADRMSDGVAITVYLSMMAVGTFLAMFVY